LLPMFHQLLNAVDDNTRLSPNLFHIDKQKQAIILEDLLVSGYKNADRTKGVDLIHAKMLITKLA